MDMNRFKQGVKRDLKANVTPGKVLRTAFVPHTKGMLNPIRDIFGVFVMIIGQLFVQARLIDKDHPAMRKELTGLNAVWAMILDASANLKFKRENAYQIVVFYGVVGMLIFGALDFVTFVLNYSMGSAHAQVVQNTGSLFSENSTDNGPSWINNILPYNATGDTGAGLPYAMQGMLVTYNSALLALGTALALYQLVTLFVESAHHGNYGGTRYSQLYAPLRMVMGIGLLVPFVHGYNSAEIIAIDMAKMGSGLASNVWTMFVNQMTNQGASSQPPPGEINQVLQKLIVDETCMVGANNQNTGTSTYPNGQGSGAPNWVQTQMVEQTSLGPIPGTDTHTAGGALGGIIFGTGQDGQYFTVHFDRNQGDAYCGTLTIPAQQSNIGQMSQVNYVEQAFVGGNGGGQYSNGGQGILTDIWWIAAAIYNNSQGGASSGTGQGYDPTQNVFCTGTTAGGGCSAQSYNWNTATAGMTSDQFEDWQDFAGVMATSTTTTSSQDGTDTVNTNATAAISPVNNNQKNELNAIWQAEKLAYNDYYQNVSCIGPNGVAGSNGNTPNPNCAVSRDWTQAGYLFLKVSHNAEDMYNVVNPTLQVELPNPDVMQDLTKLQCPAWYNLVSHKAWSCTSAGEKVDVAVTMAMDDVQSAAKYAGVSPVTFNVASNGSGNDGGLLNWAISAVQSKIMAGFSAIDVGSKGPIFGQSIFNVMQLGNVLMVVAGGLFVTGAALGTMMTPVLGEIISGFAALIMPLGFSLAVMIPLLPAGRFIFGLFTWLLTLFEAMVTMPLVALVSIRSDGEGLFFHGQAGWYILLQMMMRPVLMVFGLMAGVVVFDVLAGFVNTTVFTTYTTFTHSGNTGAVTGLIGIIGFLYFYIITLYALANVSFGMINQIPDRVLQWIGAPSGIGSNDHTEGMASQTYNAVGGQLAKAGASGVDGYIRAQQQNQQLPPPPPNNPPPPPPPSPAQNQNLFPQPTPQNNTYAAYNPGPITPPAGAPTPNLPPTTAGVTTPAIANNPTSSNSTAAWGGANAFAPLRGASASSPQTLESNQQSRTSNADQQVADRAEQRIEADERNATERLNETERKVEGEEQNVKDEQGQQPKSAPDSLRSQYKSLFPKPSDD